jgi:CubicO group peptidase (beta-lactamase class C family)
MISRRAGLFGIVGGLSAGLATSACANGVVGHADLAGRWGGAFGSGPNALRLVLEIAAGQPIVLISVDQSNARIPASSGSCGRDQLDLRFDRIGGRLKLSRVDGTRLEGTWSQGPEQAVVFTRLAQGQDPVAPPQAPFVGFQDEVDKARSSGGLPALGGAFIARRAEELETQEAVSGVLVMGESQAVAQGLKWHIGSITKSMTATLVARLVERGTLQWDMKLATAFSAIAPNMVPAYRDITLAQLMTGRSGMPTNIGMASVLGHLTSSQTPTQRRRVWVQQALALPPVNPNGTGFVYPNNGYVLAGALCETLMGKPYETLMQEEVFAPLGMTTAGFGAPPVGNPQGHRKALIGGRLIPIGADDMSDNPAPMSPAGRAHMSLSDLAKYGLAHSEGHQGLRNAYLSQATWQYLHTPPVRTSRGNDYAFGWVARRDGTLWHNGSNTFWLAELAFHPGKTYAACACASVASADSAVSRVLAAGLAQAKG